MVREDAAHLNALGTHTACYVSVEPAHNAPTLSTALFALLGSLLRSIRLQLPEEKRLQGYLEDVLADEVTCSSPVPAHSVLLDF